MRVVTDDHVGAAIHRKAGLGAIGLPWFAHVRHAPMKRDDDAIDSFLYRSDVRRQILRGVHGTARPGASGGSPPIPIIAKQSHTEWTGLQNGWRMSRWFVHARPDGCDTGFC